MPYSREHKAETRQKIVVAARQLFNRRGFVEVSIDQIMARAGLTRGGFYNHFSNKEELYAEAIVEMVDNPQAKAFEACTVDFNLPPDVLAQRIIEGYLSRAHFDNVEGGCPMIALPSDVARGGEGVKRAYRRALNAIIGIFQASQGAEAPGARSRAVAMAILCIGGMVLARAADDGDFADEIRDIAQKAALKQGGWEPAVAEAAE